MTGCRKSGVYDSLFYLWFYEVFTTTFLFYNCISIVAREPQGLAWPWPASGIRKDRSVVMMSLNENSSQEA